MYPDTKIDTVLPSSIGLLSNSTTISVVGSNFFDTTHLRCQLSMGSIEYIMMASLVTSTIVQCSIPSLSYAGIYTVELSFDGSTFTHYGNTLNVYTGAVLQRIVSPSSGYGNTTLVTVTGTGFFNQNNLACKFGTVLR